MTCLLCFCSEDPGKKDEPPNPVSVAIRAADVSFLPEIEEFPTTFYNSDGTAADVLGILKENGCNMIRIRLWHTPANEHSSLQEVVELAERVRAKDMKVWLTVHYSDTWADPANQTKPAAWDALNTTDLGDSVYNYTKKIIAYLHPDVIQIGNEINDGFLWPTGRISTNSTNFITLIKKGVQAVRDFSPATKIMVHYAGHEANWFYQLLQTQNVSYDMIGISYYPVYHGTNLNTVKINLNNLGFTYAKEIVIAETSYPFTLEWEDNTHNPVGLPEHLVPGYPATPDGQKNFLLALKQILSDTEKGTGFCYWAPEWIAFKGAGAADGSSGENLALFDFNNKALPALTAFE